MSREYPTVRTYVDSPESSFARAPLVQALAKRGQCYAFERGLFFGEIAAKQLLASEGDETANQGLSAHDEAFLGILSHEGFPSLDLETKEAFFDGWAFAAERNQTGDQNV